VCFCISSSYFFWIICGSAFFFFFLHHHHYHHIHLFFFFLSIFLLGSFLHCLSGISGGGLSLFSLFSRADGYLGHFRIPEFNEFVFFFSSGGFFSCIESSYVLVCTLLSIVRFPMRWLAFCLSERAWPCRVSALCCLIGRRSSLPSMRFDP
jgi:hypothetical protein